jgi:hypothetical protein
MIKFLLLFAVEIFPKKFQLDLYLLMSFVLKLFLKLSCWGFSRASQNNIFPIKSCYRKLSTLKFQIAREFCYSNYFPSKIFIFICLEQSHVNRENLCVFTRFDLVKRRFAAQSTMCGKETATVL